MPASLFIKHDVSKQLQGIEITDFVSFCLFIFFRKRLTSCDVMFSAALMLTWLIYHKTPSGPVGLMLRVRGEGGAPVWRGARSTARALSGGGGRGTAGGGGARERRGACWGEIVTRTQINARQISKHPKSDGSTKSQTKSHGQ